MKDFIHSLDLATRKFIEDFSLFIKQCYRIVEKIEKVKVQKLKGRTKNRRIMLLSKCAVCDSKKSKFIKEQN